MEPNYLKVKIYNSVEEAPNYTTPEFQEGSLDAVAVVKNGTEGGRSTVDLIFTDDKGQKYIAMISARLLKKVADFCKDEN